MEVPYVPETLSSEELQGVNYWPGDGTSEEEIAAAKQAAFDRHKEKFRDLPEVAAELREKLSGQWESVLGLDFQAMKKGIPCPRCGTGRDRFRVFDDSEKSGAIFCRKCPHDGSKPFFCTSNGVDTYAWLKGIEWGVAVKELAAQYGVPIARNADAPKPKPLSIIEQVCRAKRMPLESFVKYGVTEAVRANRACARVAVYNEFGEAFSYFDLFPSKDKGMCKTGKGNSGLFLPSRTPQSGETWCILEGVKDAAALDSIGYLACGLPTSTMYEKYARLFANVHVICVPDLDAAGMEGAEKTLGRLYKIARSVSLARMPGEIQGTDGDGAREILAKMGPDALRKVIDTATPWRPRQADSGKLSQRQRQRQEAIDKLKEFTDEWEIVCVLGEPNMFRLTGEFFDKAGEYLEIPIETLTSFAKFQNCIAERCRKWLDPDAAEGWHFVVKELMDKVIEIDGGVERSQTRLVALTIFNLITQSLLVEVKTRLTGDVLNDGQYCGISRDRSHNCYWVEFSRLCEELDRKVPEFKPIALTRCMEICKIEYGSVRVSDKQDEPSTSRRWRRIDHAGLTRIGIYGEAGDEQQVEQSINGHKKPAVTTPRLAEGSTPDDWTDGPESDMQFEEAL